MRKTARLPVRDMQRRIIAYAIVDKSDLSTVDEYPWHLNEGGYVETDVPHPLGGFKANGKPRRFKLLLHRCILGLGVGDADVSDHINRNKLDNRHANLRIGTRALNAQNKGVQTGSTSGVRGVHWDKARGLWTTQARLDHVAYNLGRYKTVEEASAVVSAWRKANMPWSVESG